MTEHPLSSLLEGVHSNKPIKLPAGKFLKNLQSHHPFFLRFEEKLLDFSSEQKNCKFRTKTITVVVLKKEKLVITCFKT